MNWGLWTCSLRNKVKAFFDCWKAFKYLRLVAVFLDIEYKSKQWILDWTLIWFKGFNKSFRVCHGRCYGLITRKNKLRVAYFESKYCIKLNKHKLKFNGNVHPVNELKVLFGAQEVHTKSNTMSKRFLTNNNSYSSIW